MLTTMSSLLITVHTRNLSLLAINNSLSSSVGKALVKKLLICCFPPKMWVVILYCNSTNLVSSGFCIPFDNIFQHSLCNGVNSVLKISLFFQTCTLLPYLKMQLKAPQLAGLWRMMETVASMLKWPTVWRMTWRKAPLLSSKQTQPRRRDWYC